MSAIRVDQNILNQRGTPAFFADDFSRRPAAGYQGRIFISTDTHEIYRDDTTAWVLIADAGAGSGTLQSVTANGNTTSYGIDILGVGLRVQAGGITDYTIPSGGIMFGSPSYLLTTDTTNLFWDDTNNRLGLGTNTPSARLDIHATGTNATFNGTGTSNSTLVFQRSGTSRWTIGNYYSSAVADDFNIYDNVNSQYRFYVHNTGVINIPTSLIIGSSTPTSSYILDVSGTGRFTGALTGTSATFSGVLTSSSLVLTGVGSVLSRGGSTTNNVYGYFNNTSGAFYWGTESSAGSSIITNNPAYYGAISSTGLGISGNNGTNLHMVVTSSGNVGFATSTPKGKVSIYISSLTTAGTFASSALQINNPANVGDYSQITFGYDGGATTYASAYIGYVSTSAANNGLGDIVMGTRSVTTDTQPIERLRITSGGNVLIGTTTDSGYKLDINGDLRTYGSTAALTYADRSSGSYIFYATGGITYFYNGSNKASINMTTGVYTPLSDINKKKDLELSTIGLDAILSLKPTLYRILDEENTEKHLGFIAQEVKEFIPQAYVESGEDKDKFIGLDYQAITSTLVKAIQELNEKLVRNNIN